MTDLEKGYISGREYADTIYKPVVIDLMAHLAAAISLLERGSKKAAASDKIFDIMINDYRKSVENARDFIFSPEHSYNYSGDDYGKRPVEEGLNNECS